MPRRMLPLKRVEQREIGDAIKFGISFLKRKGIAEPRLNAETLLAYLIGKERFTLYINEKKHLKSWQWNSYRHLLKRRGGFVPLQYLLDSVNFFGFDFVVNKKVFIPRPETEILIETALIKLKKAKGRVKVLDLGTGCGNIALSLAKLSRAEVYAIDISKSALAVAKRNSQRLRIREKRVHFLQGDCFEPLKKKRIAFQLILSSPPYIPRDRLAALSEEIKFEPKIALDGGEDGLDLFRRIIEKAHLFLGKDGYLILEMGINQSVAIKNLVKSNKSLSLKDIIPDYQGIERVAIIKNK